MAELFRGTMVRHTAVAYRDDDFVSGVLDFAASDAAHWVPVPAPSALAVEERLPPGAAAALLNRAHTDTDLVLFVDRDQYDVFRAIDGSRTVAELGAGAVGLVERLWRHDLVVIDATRGGIDR